MMFLDVFVPRLSLFIKDYQAYGASLYCDNQIQLSFVHEGLAKMNSFSVS